TLDRPGAPNRRFTAVNLGAMGLAADGYAARLERFGYLMPDVVCVLFDPPGPRRRPWMPSDDSAVTAATGYVPLLPLVVEEKHRGRPIVAVAAAFTRVDRQLFRLLYRPRDERDTPQDRVDAYGSAAARAASAALDRHAAAVVVLPPCRHETDAQFHRSVPDVLLVAGLAHPPLLKYPSAAWWKFSRALGYVNARVLLTILFAVVLVPVSVIWRLLGKDPLERRRGRSTGWSPYPARYRDPRHY